jgi:hypothetical protein
MELTVEQARKIVAVVHPNTVYYREAMKVLLKSVGGPQQPLQHPSNSPQVTYTFGSLEGP